MEKRLDGMSEHERRGSRQYKRAKQTRGSESDGEDPLKRVDLKKGLHYAERWVLR